MDDNKKTKDYILLNMAIKADEQHELNKQQVFVYDVTDEYNYEIPVLAKNKEEADRIFDEWADSDKGSKELDDLLNNGYLGRKVLLLCTKDVGDFPVDDILLPKEHDKPEVVKPYYNIHIRFSDGHIQNFFDRTMVQMINDLALISEAYILFPDPEIQKRDSSYIEVLGDGMDTTIWFYAIKKEKLTHHELYCNKN